MKRHICFLLTVIILIGLMGCSLGGPFSTVKKTPAVLAETPLSATVTPNSSPEVTESSTVTAAPTSTINPTVVPTEVPTPVPTEVPTAVPTEVPTPTPTAAPTLTPTQAPTPTPTIKPTPTPTATPVPTPSPTPKEGVFSVNAAADRHSLSKPFPESPKTFEARFSCSTGVTPCGEVILGNYKDQYTPGMYFGIDPSGYPTLYININEINGEAFSISEFVLQNGCHDVAFSIFDDRVCGYLDGKLLLEKPYSQALPTFTGGSFSVLGDDTANNSYWFKNGELFRLNVYSAPRTIEQIQNDFLNTDTTDETLLVSFDFETSKEDQSKYGNNIVPYWHDGEYIAKDSYKYTMAVVGDIQTLLNKHIDKVPKIFDYILENKEAFNIKRAIFLGDLTENNSESEWTFVRSQVERFDNVIPYSLVRGNHDGFIGEHHDLSAFNNCFGGEGSPYAAQYDGCFNGKINNTYKFAEIEGVKYLFLNLDFGPTDKVLAWAGEICEKYSDRNVIISLHSFLFCDGTLSDRLEPQEKYAVDYNSSENIWEKFASNHANISMIISGHTPSNDVVIRDLIGKNGNVVKAILSDSQYIDKFMDGDGIVNLLHFDENGKLVSIETFSAAKNKFYKTDNQIIFP